MHVEHYDEDASDGSKDGLGDNLEADESIHMETDASYVQGDLVGMESHVDGFDAPCTGAEVEGSVNGQEDDARGLDLSGHQE